MKKQQCWTTNMSFSFTLHTLTPETQGVSSHVLRFSWAQHLRGRSHQWTSLHTLISGAGRLSMAPALQSWRRNDRGRCPIAVQDFLPWRLNQRAFGASIKTLASILSEHQRLFSELEHSFFLPDLLLDGSSAAAPQACSLTPRRAAQRGLLTHKPPSPQLQPARQALDRPQPGHPSGWPRSPQGQLALCPPHGTKLKHPSSWHRLPHQQPHREPAPTSELRTRYWSWWTFFPRRTTVLLLVGTELLKADPQPSQQAALTAPRQPLLWLLLPWHPLPLRQPAQKAPRKPDLKLQTHQPLLPPQQPAPPAPLQMDRGVNF